MGSRICHPNSSNQGINPARTTEDLPLPEAPKRPTKIKVLQNWFEKTQPASPDFDPDQAKWEYLKEKHNL